MNRDEFRFLWCGQAVAPLLDEQMGLLSPIDIRGVGRDRALLMLHGFSSTPSVFRAMLPNIVGYDAVVCPVLPGHADSLMAFAQVQATDWLAAAEDACRALLRDYTTVDVLGFSLGGLLACHLSQRLPLNHLFLLAPALFLRLNVSMALCAARVLQALGCSRLRNRGGNLRTNRYAELTYRQVPLPVIIQILSLVKTFHFVPPACSTDVFLGRFDEVVDSSRIAALVATIPQVRTHWLEQSAHILPLDGDYEAIIECINNA
jgi:carboxylesterase